MEEAVALILQTWSEPRTTFHGRYFHVEDAILEPKPVQKPRPPVMIAGGGEQMTLRAVARLADACNIVDGDVAEVRHKLEVLRRHCDAVGRDYDTIEKTCIQPWSRRRQVERWDALFVATAPLGCGAQERSSHETARGAPMRASLDGSEHRGTRPTLRLIRQRSEEIPIGTSGESSIGIDIHVQPADVLVP
jgi:alkanesulfonate monooxygenase SsuD/methylene tetrahydromethanopterin reductase-like flavin-dependent oxidoreductase (luciferase family)